MYYVRLRSWPLKIQTQKRTHMGSSNPRPSNGPDGPMARKEDKEPSVRMLNDLAERERESNSFHFKWPGQETQRGQRRSWRTCPRHVSIHVPFGQVCLKIEAGGLSSMWRDRCPSRPYGQPPLPRAELRKEQGFLSWGWGGVDYAHHKGIIAISLFLSLPISFSYVRGKANRPSIIKQWITKSFPSLSLFPLQRRDGEREDEKRKRRKPHLLPLSLSLQCGAFIAIFFPPTCLDAWAT